MGGNITALEVKGNFDDCQRMVKEAFQDAEIRSQLEMTSANSINIARLIPQMFYYFWACAQLPKATKEFIISVPSGNFGNLTAGLMAKRMGLPVDRFVMATNVNDVVPKYLETGTFTARASQKTISNAMDVGNPSNFARMLDLYGNKASAMRRDIIAFSFTDAETKQMMRVFHKAHGYVLDPHGAVGCLGLQKYHTKYGQARTCIFLETAHPAKFQSTVEKTLGKKVKIPPQLKQYFKRKKKAALISNKFEDLKKFLLSI